MTEAPSREPSHEPPPTSFGEVAVDGSRLALSTGARPALSSARRIRAWRLALDRLLDPASEIRQGLDPELLRSVRLSPRGLQAGLEAIGSGLRGATADEMFARAEEMAAPSDRNDRAPPALVILASNLPGLCLQTLLPALALDRDLIVRSSRREPHLAPALLRELAGAEPGVASRLAALSWDHGSSLERSLLERCDPVLAYGGRSALDALRPRVAGRLVEYGPKLSIALVGPDAGDDEIERLARDVALFDQRGCLSVQIVVALRPPDRVARALAVGLDRLAEELPPGPATLTESAAVRREIDLSSLRGDRVVATRAGWIVTESGDAPLAPSPGRRFVRLRGIADGAREPLAAARDLISPIASSIQGVAVAGLDPDSVERSLQGLGPVRIAPAGALQETDARWHNGGLDPLEALARR